MKRIGVLLFAVLSLVSCSKMVTVASIEGTWAEQYDPSVFAMDGIVEFTFDADNKYQLWTNDGLSCIVKSHSGSYALNLTKKNTITLNPQMSDDSNITYTIVKLTEDEMAWQKEGTTYSKGTWGSDYRHFVRVRYRDF